MIMMIRNLIMRYSAV